jgi:3-oxoacyl-[acyl-carrier protein] reductase
MVGQEASRDVVITGARGRLGSAMVKAFQVAGWGVWAANRSAEKPESGVNGLVLDLTDDASIAAGIHSLLDRKSRLPDEIALIANASNREALNVDWQDCDRSAMHAIFDVDVVGHFMLARALREAAIEKKITLSVVFIGSIYGLGGVKPSIYPEGMAPTPLQYSVSKAALTGLTRDLAGRWGDDGIRVNCLAPGGIYAEQDAQFIEAYSQHTPSGRLVEAQEIAEAAVMLCSSNARAINGQVICADGGWTAW